MRAPVMPKGWPRAMAPPWGLRRSSKGSMPMPRAEGMTWAAKASLISTTSTSSMAIPARSSACLLASIGPSPMISGLSEVSPVETMRASGVMPELAGAVVGHHHHRGGAVVERAGVARGDRPVLAEHRLEGGEHLDGGARPGAVVAGHGGAVGTLHRDDLAVEEAVGLRLHRAVLTARREAVHLLAGDLLALGDVLRGLAHRDVHVGIARRRSPARTAGSDTGACPSCRWRSGTRTRRRRDTKTSPSPACDRVAGHPGGLQRRGAVAGDGRPGRRRAGRGGSPPGPC